MKSLPPDLRPYKKTDVFTKETVPKGLLKEHHTMAGVWGKIVILEGGLIYTIDDENKEGVMLTPDYHGVVEPQVVHHITPLNGVKFFIEFYK